MFVNHEPCSMKHVKRHPYVDIHGDARAHTHTRTDTTTWNVK